MLFFEISHDQASNSLGIFKVVHMSLNSSKFRRDQTMPHTHFYDHNLAISLLVLIKTQLRIVPVELRVSWIMINLSVRLAYIQIIIKQT